VIARVQDGKLLIDLRTVSKEEEPTLVECLVQAIDCETKS